MFRCSKFLLALALGFVGTGGCGSRGGEEPLPDDAARAALLQLAATGISANITTSAWGNGIGFGSQIVVTNTGTTPTTNWEVVVQFTNSAMTDSLSNAVATTSGSITTYRPQTYNAAIQPGSSVTISFNGAWSASPHTVPTVTSVRRDFSNTGTGGASSGGAAGNTSKGGSGGTLTGGTTAKGGSSSGGSLTGGVVGSTSGGSGGSGGAAANIALGKPATASSELLPGNPASFGNDVAENTDWCAASTGTSASWQVDLSGSYDVTGTSITWPVALAGYGYIIQASSDNVAYSNVVDKHINPSSAQIQSDSFTVRASYLRVAVTGIPASLTRVCLRDFKATGSLVNAGAGGGGGASTGAGGTASTSSGGSGGSSGAGMSGGNGGAIGTSGGSGGATAAGGAVSGGSSSGGSGGAATPVVFSFQLPKGVDRSRIAFGVTGGELWINDHSKVQAPTGVGGYSSISAVANGRVTRLGTYCEVRDLYSEGDVALANQALVHGDLAIRGNITGQNGYQIFGKTIFNAPIVPTEVVSWTVPFPDMSGEPAFLQPDSGTHEFPPGAYNGFTVQRGAHLKLVAGVYYLNALTVESLGYLDIDNTAGAVIVYVRNNLTLRGSHSRAVTGRGFFIGYAGTNPVALGTPVQGILVAPNAQLTFAAGQTAFAGSFYAKNITVDQFNYVDHEPWTHDSLCATTEPCSAFCPCGPSDTALCTNAAGCQAGLSCTTAGHCACLPQCAGKHCGDELADGCGGNCPMVCNNGEIGCKADADCKEGSLCLPKGELKGFPPKTNICLPAICYEADPREPGCGVSGADCGSCPACLPQCNGRNCGPNGCGGTCGSTPANQVCLGGLLVDAANPAMDHSAGFPAAIPINFFGAGAEAGAIPSRFSVTDRGTAAYTIPIQMPPGRQGLVPNLSLTYESTRSSGMVGLGWGIGGFSKVERCNRIAAVQHETAPVALSALDAFCLDGVVLVDALTGDGALKPAHTHETELERFEVIRAIGNQWEGSKYVGPSAFRVWTKDGHILTYGAVDEYNRLALGATSTRTDGIVDSNGVHRAWHLSQIEDHAGNFASYVYQRTADDSGTTTEIIPESVLFGQKQDPTLPTGNPYFGPTSAVEFTYVDNPKPTHHYVAGFLTYQTKLLHQIDSYTVSNVGFGAYPVTSYKLAYSDPDALGPRLQTVTQCSRGVSGSAEAERCLPPSTMKYTEFGGYALVNASSGADDSPRCFSADVDGDGSGDAICDFKWVKYRGPAAGAAATLEVMSPAPGVGTGTLIMDVNRDGRDDVVSCSGSVHINRATPTGPEFEQQNLYGPSDPSASRPAASRDCRARDVDGDGLPDLLTLSWFGVTWKRQGATGLEPEQELVARTNFPQKQVLTDDLDGDGDADVFGIRSDDYAVVPITATTELPTDFFGNVALVKPLATLDANGDGLMDYLHYKLPVDAPEPNLDTSYFILLLNTGNGFVARPFVTPWLCVVSGESWFGRFAFVLDIDQDGRDDIVVRHTQPACPSGIMRATRRGTFEWDGTADVSMFDSTVPDRVTLIDLNGDGVKDVLFGASSARVSRTSAPGLLKSITNGLGERITMTYDTSVTWPTSDGVTAPTVVPTYSPGSSDPLNLTTRSVRRVAPLVTSYRTDQVSPYSGALAVAGPQHYFHYVDGRMGLGGRGWYGFAERWIADTNSSGIQVAETRIAYHNDAYWRAGLVKSIAARSAPIGAGLFHSGYSREVYTSNEWQQLTSSLSGRPHAWLRYQSVAEFESSASQLRRVERTWNPDSYGNVASMSAKTYVGEDGIVRESAAVATSYHIDAARWLTGLPELVTTTDSHGSDTAYRQTKYEYSVDGLLVNTTREPNRADVRLLTTYERDPVSRNVTKVTRSDEGGVSRWNRIVYDGRDLFPVAHENANGDVTEVQYDGRTGQLLTVMDPNGVIVQRGYDPFGRMELEKGPTQQRLLAYLPKQSYVSTAAGGTVWVANTVEETISPKGGSSFADFDAVGRVVRSGSTGLNGKMVFSEYERDWAGRIVRQTQPHVAGSMTQGAVSYSRDVMGRVIATTAPDGRVTHQEYVSRGNVSDPTLLNGEAVSALVRLEPNNLVEYRLADHRSIPTQVVQYDASSGASPHEAIVAGIASATTYEIGAFGVPHSVTDADGEVTSFVADSIGRRLQLDADSIGLTQTTYNGFGDVVDETDANGDKSCFSYDSLGRPTAVRRALSTGACPETGAFVSSWQYGTNVGEIGKLVSTYRESFSGSGTGAMQVFRYEVPTPGAGYAGRLKSVEQTVPGLADALTTSYDYDGPYLGDVHYPSAAGVPFTVRYSRDSYGNLTSVADASGGGAPTTEYWKLLSDDEGQRIESESQGNGVTVTNYQYNRLGVGCVEAGSCMPGSLRMIRTSPGSNPSQSLQQLEYKYDSGGYLQHIEYFEMSHSVGSSEFRHDAFGRLQQEDYVGSVILNSTMYDYSPGGDIQSVTNATVGGSSTVEPYSYLPSRPRLVDHFGTTGYGYDLKGRQISRSGPAVEGTSQVIDYNDLDLPERVTVGGTAVHRFEYDAGGSRVAMRSPESTSVYAGEHYRCTGATTASSSFTCAEHQYSLFVGDRLIAEITKDSSGTIEKQRYVHADHLGSSTVITDETGAVIEKRGYKPFGASKASFIDTELRVGFAGQEHDGELGLINMRGRMYDPKLRRFITPDPFVTEPWNPAGLNRFSYVQNSPLNFIDPSGFQMTEPDGGGGGSGGGSDGCGGEGGGGGAEGTSGQGDSTNNRPMTDQGTPATAQSASGDYQSQSGYGNYFIDACGLLAPSESSPHAGPAGVYSQPQGPMSMAAPAGAPADMGGGTPQSSGATQSQSGPTTESRGSMQQSGDGSGQPSSAVAPAVGAGALVAALPKPAGASGLWAAIAPYLSASAILGAVGAVGIFIAGSDSARPSGNDGAVSPADILKDAKPEGMSKPGMGSDKYSKPGGMDEANRDFDDIAKGTPVKDKGGGTRVTTLPDGTNVTVRPNSTEGSPTVEIIPPSGNRTKIRYR